VRAAAKATSLSHPTGLRSLFSVLVIDGLIEVEALSSVIFVFCVFGRTIIREDAKKSEATVFGDCHVETDTCRFSQTGMNHHHYYQGTWYYSGSGSSSSSSRPRLVKPPTAGANTARWIFVLYTDGAFFYRFDYHCSFSKGGDDYQLTSKSG